MPYKNPEYERIRERRRNKRLTAERIASGICPRCGKAPPAPDRSSCENCLDKRRASERARYEKARARGKPYNGRDAETCRRKSRERTRRRYHARQNAGLCTRCGECPPAEGTTACEQCRNARCAGERRQWSERRAEGLCGKCRQPAPDGASRCDPCTALQLGRPSRNENSRKRYARRRAQGLCTDCSAWSAGAARCAPCARRSWLRSADHRGLPVAAPRLRVIEVETGDDLGTWETWAEVHACLAFAGLDPEAVEIETDISPMASLTSW